jgi:hypothetical protein
MDEKFMNIELYIWFRLNTIINLTLYKMYIHVLIIVFFFIQCITRNKTNNLIRFVIPYAKTVTYQSSYFIRSCKTWNVLSSDLRNRDIGLFSFKSGLKSYYKHALSSTFDVDDPRTWKSVCIKCKRARSLNEAISCC